MWHWSVLHCTHQYHNDNSKISKFTKFKFKDFSKIFQYFQAPNVFSSTLKGLEVFTPNSSIFKNFSSTLWTLNEVSHAPGKTAVRQTGKQTGKHWSSAVSVICFTWRCLAARLWSSTPAAEAVFTSSSSFWLRLRSESTYESQKSTVDGMSAAVRCASPALQQTSVRGHTVHEDENEVLVTFGQSLSNQWQYHHHHHHSHAASESHHVAAALCPWLTACPQRYVTKRKYTAVNQCICSSLQRFDAVGWAAGKASGL